MKTWARLTIVAAMASVATITSITYTRHLTNILAMYATQLIAAILHNKEEEFIIPTIVKYFNIYFNRLFNKLYVKSKTSSAIPSASSVLAVTSIDAVTTIIAIITVIAITVWISIIIMALIVVTLNKVREAKYDCLLVTSWCLFGNLDLGVAITF
uniref:Uncharacterized protein n=1 Tax=Glossina austeni TaxID=7395 RepID=A0A1A9VI95_GLOAU